LEIQIASQPMSAPEVPAVPRHSTVWQSRLERLRRPVVPVAAAVTVLGGLAGYLTFCGTMASVAPASESASPSPSTGAAAPATALLSILVLPLANQSGDPAKADIADGLTNAITSDLGRIQDAVIVPPLVAVSLGQKGLSLQQLGTKARVRYVLQGGVAASCEAGLSTLRWAIC
jgi:hypothetical protein